MTTLVQSSMSSNHAVRLKQLRDVFFCDPGAVVGDADNQVCKGLFFTWDDGTRDLDQTLFLGYKFDRVCAKVQQDLLHAFLVARHNLICSFVEVHA